MPNCGFGAQIYTNIDHQNKWIGRITDNCSAEYMLVWGQSYLCQISSILIIRFNVLTTCTHTEDVVKAG